MRRRPLLAALSGVTLSGCAGLPPENFDDATSGTPTDEITDATPTGQPSPTPRELPARPESFDRKAIREYVRDYERAAKFNEIAAKGAWNIRLGSCTAVVDLIGDSRAFAYGACAGSYRTDSGAHADFGLQLSPYFVSERQTVRIGPWKIDRYEWPLYDDIYGNDGETEEFEPVGVGVFNFDAAMRTLQVQVRRLDVDGDPVIYDESKPVPGGEGLLHQRITQEPGTYRVEASLESNETVSPDWEVASNSEDIPRWKLAIYVTGAGELHIRNPPVERIYS